ncbi:hypothetical protein BT69DRAFT_1279438 [Atractiella rhizophila]|nr:hypothetical protein BT69DRAFT_1279438 [Atractiella rhizophila]
MSSLPSKTGSVSGQNIHKRVKDYQKEFKTYLEIEQNTRQMETLFKEMVDSFAIIKEGGRATADVTQNWANVFRAAHLAITSARQSFPLNEEEGREAQSSNSSVSSKEEEVQTLPDTIVRFETGR